MAEKIAKKAPGNAGQKMVADTNVYDLTVDKNMSYYKSDFRIYITRTGRDGVEKKLELTTTKRDYDDEERKKTCVKVLEFLSQKYPQFKKDADRLIYDRGASLYSTINRFPFKKGASDEENTHSFDVDTSVVNSLESRASSVKAEVKPCPDWQMSTNDIRTVASADFSVDKEKNILEVLNVITSQVSIKKPNEFQQDGRSRIALKNPASLGLEAAHITDEKHLQIVLNKSVKIGGDEKNPKTLLVVNYSKVAKHDEMLLSEKMIKLCGRYNELKGLKVRKTYGNKQMITVSGFTTGPLSSATIPPREPNGRPSRVIDYLQKQYNLQCKQANLQGVLDKKGCIFPAEHLMVMDQKLTPAQEDGNVKREVVKQNAIRAGERFQNVNKMTNALDLSSAESKKTGVTLPSNAKAKQCEARKLDPLTVKGGSVQQNGVEWKVAKFDIARSLTKWAALLVYRNERNDTEPFDFFIDKLQEEGRKMGMQTVPPLLIEKTRQADMDTFLEKAKTKGCDIVVVVSHHDGDHAALKYAERRVGIVTQQAKGITIGRIFNQPSSESVQGILKKINVKLGGVNTIVQGDAILSDPKTMIMGLVIDQPEALSKAEVEGGARPITPAVIGIGANNGSVVCADAAKKAAASQQYFTESLYYANPREWTKDESQQETLIKAIEAQIRRFKENRGAIPLKLFIYLLGVSDAERAHWVETGMAAFKKACKNINEKFNPGIYMISVNAEGNERINAQPGGGDSRGGPRGRPSPSVVGLVVDTGIVNPSMNEFLLNSALPLQGTARSKKYTLLTEGKTSYSMDDIEKFTWALTHRHDYSDKTIGMPAPVRIARDAAARGRALFNFEKNREPYSLEDINARLSSINYALAGKRTV